MNAMESLSLEQYLINMPLASRGEGMFPGDLWDSVFKEKTLRMNKKMVFAGNFMFAGGDFEPFLMRFAASEVWVFA